MVREKIAEFDSDKKEFFSKLEEMKENLKVTIESQINIEKSEQKLKSDELERNKIKNEKMFKNLKELVEQSNKN